MKVLIIRFSSIGDIVLTTPVVRCLCEQLGAEVHYLTKKSFRGIVDANPYISRVHAIQKEVTEVLADLRDERYDLIVDLHHNLRSGRVKLALGVKNSAFNKINLQKWLMVNLKIDRLPRVHIVDRYLATVAHLGITNDGKGLDYFIPEADEVVFDRAEAIVGRGKAIFGNAQYAVFGHPVSAEAPADRRATKYTAFVIGAAHATKRLPTDKIIGICQKIKDPVVLLGGPDEEAEGEQIAAAGGTHVVNACGRLRLNQSASLVRQARLVITHDTGLMHIAAAFGKEILSLWGNTIPEFGMYPYYPAGINHNTTFEIKGLSCRPCSKIGYQACPKGHFRCMREIEEGAVASWAS